MGTPLQLRPQPVGQGSGRCLLGPQIGPSRVAVDLPLAAPCVCYLGAGAAEHSYRGRLAIDGSFLDSCHPGDLCPREQRRVRPVLRRDGREGLMSDDFAAEQEPLEGPELRSGTFLVHDFAGPHDRVPEMLEFIAPWLRACSEYQLENIAVNTDDLGWSTVAVTVQELRPGDLIELLTRAGEDQLASRVAALVTEHGVRDGLRLLGLSYR